MSKLTDRQLLNVVMIGHIDGMPGLWSSIKDHKLWRRSFDAKKGEIALNFLNNEIVLQKDGTWFFTDTSGG